MIAICIGHSRYITSVRMDGGAVSAGGENEWTFNRRVGRRLHEILNSRRVPSWLCDAYHMSGYGPAMRWLAGEIRKREATLAVELHFNAAGPTAEGHEWLHWHSSSASRDAAAAFDAAFRNHYPQRKARGVKAITVENRGGEFLRLTHCPAVILEPFFGSNRAEWNFFAARPQDELATVYADAICAWLRRDHA